MMNFISYDHEEFARYEEQWFDETYSTLYSLLDDEDEGDDVEYRAHQTMDMFTSAEGLDIDGLSDYLDKVMLEATYD